MAKRPTTSPTLLSTAADRAREFTRCGVPSAAYASRTMITPTPNATLHYSAAFLARPGARDTASRFVAVAGAAGADAPPAKRPDALGLAPAPNPCFYQLCRCVLFERARSRLVQRTWLPHTACRRLYSRVVPDRGATLGTPSGLLSAMVGGPRTIEQRFVRRTRHHAVRSIR